MRADESPHQPVVHEPFLRSLVACIVGTAPSDVDAQVLQIVSGAIGRRSASLQRQLRLFLHVLRWLPLLIHGRPFERLRDDQQVRFLSGIQDAPIPLLRKGFWGVKALAFMGYYGRPGIGEGMGYAPTVRGNERLRHG